MGYVGDRRREGEGALGRGLFVFSGVLGRSLTRPETTEKPFSFPQLQIIFFPKVALLPPHSFLDSNKQNKTKDDFSGVHNYI